MGVGASSVRESCACAGQVAAASGSWLLLRARAWVRLLTAEGGAWCWRAVAMGGGGSLSPLRVRISGACLFVVTAGGCWYLLKLRAGRSLLPSAGQVVVVTGCDSGLGFSLALRAHWLGATVMAACLDEHGAGAAKLRRLCGGDRMLVARLDVTDENSVQQLVRRVAELLGSRPGTQLRALVNNAGVMVFGEFEWQTEELIRHQVNVNVLGTMRVTKAFCPLIRQHKGRIITVTSHCASQTLPGLAVYGATKAALKGWCDGLRVEQAKYGVKVITLIPGYFMMNSNLMARHNTHVAEMRAAMSLDDCNFFGDYFDHYHAALSTFAVEREPAGIQDEPLHRMFDQAVLSRSPRASYRNSPLDYTIYHWLFAVLPAQGRDMLMERFMRMPRWKETSRS